MSFNIRKEGDKKMALTVFAATAATCEIVLGTEQPIADGTLKITINPKSGDGDLQGKFRLKPNTVDGAWEGELQGRFVNGLVTSWGIARGSGALLGSVLRIDFQQVVEYPGKPPCEDPKAFFEMRGLILEQD